MSSKTRACLTTAPIASQRTPCHDREVDRLWAHNRRKRPATLALHLPLEGRAPTVHLEPSTISSRRKMTTTLQDTQTARHPHPPLSTCSILAQTTPCLPTPSWSAPPHLHRLAHEKLQSPIRTSFHLKCRHGRAALLPPTLRLVPFLRLSSRLVLWLRPLWRRVQPFPSLASFPASAATLKARTGLAYATYTPGAKRNAQNGNVDVGATPPVSTTT